MTDMDDIDRCIINDLQGGFPLSDRPWAEVAGGIGVTEHELIARVQRLLDEGVLSRFGPMYHAEQLGGALSLCAMQIDPEDLERVAAIVNGFTEVAHNYEREHALNMWFVLATERPERIEEVIEAIEQSTGYRVLNLPKRKEYYVGLQLAV